MSTADWQELEDLLLRDSTVRSVEFGSFASRTRTIDCVIRRDRPVHTISAYGRSAGQAFKKAVDLYEKQ